MDERGGEESDDGGGDVYRESEEKGKVMVPRTKKTTMKPL